MILGRLQKSTIFRTFGLIKCLALILPTTGALAVWCYVVLILTLRNSCVDDPLINCTPLTAVAPAVAAVCVKVQEPIPSTTKPLLNSLTGPADGTAES